MAHKILLIEDDKSIAEPVVYGLQKAGFTVTHATNGEEGLRLARRETFDVVLLDVMLPGIDGFETCRALRRFSAVPILMVTARGQEMERVMGLDAGADDYIVKPFSFQELLARVRALLRRVALDQQNLPREEVLQIGPIQLNRQSREVTRDGKRVELSRREFDLLTMLMSHAGKALSRQELLDRVWGESWFGTHRTLDVHIRWLREKLEEDPSNPRYIETVYGYGYRFNQEPAS
jgi:DNA-binding response OmpR family regulator